MSHTLDYYNKNAKQFAEGTLHVTLTTMQDKFYDLIPAGGKILDFGCGSGRDSLYFLTKGLDVEATDGSEELCRIASEVAGIPVKKMYFQELCEKEKYDGIWACSSILHLPYEELKDVMRKMTEAIKKDGVIYTSFKYGTFSGERHGRYFTDMTEETLAVLLEEIGGLELIEQWVTSDARPERSNEKWLNLLLRRVK